MVYIAFMILQNLPSLDSDKIHVIWSDLTAYYTFMCIKGYKMDLKAKKIVQVTVTIHR